MAEASHTAGPWEVRTSVRLPSIHAADGRCVMSTGSAYTRPLAECEANARVAAAGPELLSALVDAEAFIGGFEDDDAENGINGLLATMRAAIAKAEG